MLFDFSTQHRLILEWKVSQVHCLDKKFEWLHCPCNVIAYGVRATEHYYGVRCRSGVDATVLPFPLVSPSLCSSLFWPRCCTQSQLV